MTMTNDEYFVKNKTAKLKRMVGLRIFNLLGMVAWRNDSGDANQLLRLLHPLTWVWIGVAFFTAMILQGVPSSMKDLVYCIKNETVWWK